MSEATHASDFDPVPSHAVRIVQACNGAGIYYFTAMQRMGTHHLSFDVKRSRSRRERIARLDTLATLLDTAILIPGTNIRFGLDAVIGLVPGIGDVITTAVSLFIVHEARELGAPGHVIARMLGNVVLDGMVGAVPLVGDAFDVLWRSNQRNLRLFHNWMEKEEKQSGLRRY